jgi:RNA polymerase sporulation-specific sigma factor
MEHTLALIEEVHRGDKKAREQVIEENMGLVYTVVHRFVGRGCELEDLVQIGSIGLIKAIDHFDTSYDVKFSTYAVPVISGEIKRYLRDSNGMIKVSRMLKETAARAGRVREELTRQRGQEPALQEVADELGVPAEELVMALESSAEVESLSQTVYSGDGTPVLLEDRLPDLSNHNEELLNRMLLAQLLELLDDREQEVIRLRYFEDCTQVQVAERLGMTQVQVSRAEKRILRKMRNGAD